MKGWQTPEAPLEGDVLTVTHYLVNRAPHAMLEDSNPHKLPYGTEATLLHLRTIGAQAFVHIEMHTKKLKDNAREGKLCGYSSDSKAYRVYNPATREAIKNRLWH